MKIYIKSNSEQIFHITDLFDKIESVVYTDDITTFKRSSIECSENDIYMDYSDDELLSLPKNELKSITDLDVLDRLRALDRNILTRYQKDLLRDEYKTKVIIDRSDVIEILNRLKQCNDFYRTRRDKNKAFEVKHNMKMQDYLNIIHELSIRDYVTNTKSVDNKYLGNDLIVFIPKRDFTLLNGAKLKDILIYIKIDLTETDDAIAAISFHDASGDEFKPYKS